MRFRIGQEKIITQTQIQRQTIINFPIVLDEEAQLLRPQIEWTAEDLALANEETRQAKQDIGLAVSSTAIRNAVGSDETGCRSSRARW